MVPALIALFLALIGTAWALTNPPGAGPDEGAHYVKALGAGAGHLYGSKPAPGRAEIQALVGTKRSSEERAKLEAFLGAGTVSAQTQWQRLTSREFTVPAGLSFNAFGCGRWKNDDWGRCLDEGTSSSEATDRSSYVGTYQPYVYIASGLVMRRAGDPFTALRLGRLANAALSLGLLLLAAIVLWDRSRGALSLAGLIVAITPMVVFFAANLNPTGPELAGAVCFAAALLRLARGSDAPPVAWVACAAGGSVLGLSRSLGPGFVVLLLAAVALLAGRGRAVAVLRQAPRAAAVTAATVAAACVAGLVWELRYQPHVPHSPGRILDGVGPSFDVLPRMPKEAVGVFGALDTFMPLGPYLIWWLMLALLVGAALWVGRGSERAWLLALPAAIVVVTLGTSAVYRQTGFALQARYVLPFALLLPLAAGELLQRHVERLRPAHARGLLLGAAGGAAAVHVVAWYANGRRVSVGRDGDWLFASQADWVPPLGWWTWIAVVAVAAAVYVVAGVKAARAIAATR
jgi:hypothetical protein